MARIDVREATDAEVARIYGSEARHFVGPAEGNVVACIGFRRIGSDVWGIYHPFEPAHPSVWTRLFYAFRRELRSHTEPVYVFARDADSSRVLRLLGFEPTGDAHLGKDVWRWTPGQ